MANLYEQFLNEWSHKWFQFIKDNSNKPWDYLWLSKNPNINWEIVQSNPDKSRQPLGLRIFKS